MTKPSAPLESSDVEFSYDDEFYRDILAGLVRYLESPFIEDVLATLSYLSVPELGSALNKSQMACKKWLLDELYRAVGARVGKVHVLGGWYGVLSAMLLHDSRFEIEQVRSYDIDPECQRVAESLNRTHVETSRFAAVTADMLALDFDSAIEDVIVNTSCEHLDNFDDWYSGLPAGNLLVLQSNDYYAVDEHVNCVPDLAAFRRQAPMVELLFKGEFKLKRYTRFMVIGRK